MTETNGNGCDYIPGEPYRMLRDLDVRDKRNWVPNVRCKFYQFGFGHVGLNQGVGRGNTCSCMFSAKY